MPGIKGTRVSQGDSMPGSKDRRTGDNAVAGGSEISSATNAKRSISGVENQNTSSQKSVQPKTRQTTSGG